MSETLARLRALLGITPITEQLEHLHEHARRQENTMTTMLELLTGLTNQTAEASAAQQASFLNLHNGMNRLAQQVTDLHQQLSDAAANSGQVTEEMQVKASEISESLADMKKAAETADNGFEPIDTPVEDGPDAEVPATPDVPVEVPADETPTVPVVTEPVVDEGNTSRRR